MLASAPDLVLYDMMVPFNMLAAEAHGIGYSVYFYAAHINPGPDVTMIGVNGVMPTAETISNGTYPLLSEVYVAIRGDSDADDSAFLLRDWLLSAEGQEVVASSGYVPLP